MCKSYLQTSIEIQRFDIGRHLAQQLDRGQEDAVELILAKIVGDLSHYDGGPRDFALNTNDNNCPTKKYDYTHFIALVELVHEAVQNLHRDQHGLGLPTLHNQYLKPDYSPTIPANLDHFHQRLDDFSEYVTLIFVGVEPS